MSDWTKNKKLDKKAKDAKDEITAVIADLNNPDAKFLNGALGNITTKSAYKRIAIGALSGWFVGFSTIRLGKLTGIVIGTSVILIDIAQQQGYIEVNWSRMRGTLEDSADKIDRAVTGQQTSWTDKAERFLDRKIDKVENKTKKWYNKLMGDDQGKKLAELRVFVAAFIGGVALGVATG